MHGTEGRRNELLAELFQRSHRIEKWGRGIKMILEREPATEFEEMGTVQFIVTFKRKSVDRPVDSLQGTDSQKSSQKSSQKILDMIACNPHITIREMAVALNITDRAVKKNIDRLKKENVLKRIGPDKGGYWEII